MRQKPRTKLQLLDARHPGLREKVHAMFEGLWPLKDVKHMIETHYGERVGLRTIEKYKSAQWQAQRESVQQISAVLSASPASVGDTHFGLR
jgi:hypothetical protein